MAALPRPTGFNGQSETPGREKPSARKATPLSPVTIQSNASQSIPKLPSPLNIIPASSKVRGPQPAFPFVEFEDLNDLRRHSMSIDWCMVNSARHSFGYKILMTDHSIPIQLRGART